MAIEDSLGLEATPQAPKPVDLARVNRVNQLLGLPQYNVEIPEPGFTTGAQRRYYDFKGAIWNTFAETEEGLAARDWNREQAMNLGEPMTPRDVNGPLDFINYASEVIGSSLVDLTAIAAATAAGSAVGMPTVGGAAALTAIHGIDTASGVRDEGLYPSMDAVLPATAAKVALDLVPFNRVMKKLQVQKTYDEAAIATAKEMDVLKRIEEMEKVTGRRFNANDIMNGIFEQSITEGATELAQQYIDQTNIRFLKSEDLWARTPEERQELLDAMFGGFIAGGALGGAAEVVGKFVNNPQDMQQEEWDALQGRLGEIRMEQAEKVAQREEQQEAIERNIGVEDIRLDGVQLAAPSPVLEEDLGSDGFQEVGEAFNRLFGDADDGDIFLAPKLLTDPDSAPEISMADPEQVLRSAEEALAMEIAALDREIIDGAPNVDVSGAPRMSPDSARNVTLPGSDAQMTARSHVTRTDVLGNLTPLVEKQQAKKPGQVAFWARPKWTTKEERATAEGYRKVAEAVSKRLLGGARVILTTTDEATGRTGTTYIGVSSYDRQSDTIIIGIRPDALLTDSDRALGLEFLGHELGHAIIAKEYSDADSQTKRAILAEYRVWLEDIRNLSFKEFAKKYYAPAAYTDVISDPQYDAVKDTPAYLAAETLYTGGPKYLFSFDEYAAQQIARYIGNNAATYMPESEASNFFKRVIQRLKAMFAMVESLPQFKTGQVLTSWLKRVEKVHAAVPGRQPAAKKIVSGVVKDDLPVWLANDPNVLFVSDTRGMGGTKAYLVVNAKTNGVIGSLDLQASRTGEGLDSYTILVNDWAMPANVIRKFLKEVVRPATGVPVKLVVPVGSTTSMKQLARMGFSAPVTLKRRLEFTYVRPIFTGNNFELKPVRVKNSLMGESELHLVKKVKGQEVQVGVINRVGDTNQMAFMVYEKIPDSPTMWENFDWGAIVEYGNRLFKGKWSIDLSMAPSHVRQWLLRTGLMDVSDDGMIFTATGIDASIPTLTDIDNTDSDMAGQRAAYRDSTVAYADVKRAFLDVMPEDSDATDVMDAIADFPANLRRVLTQLQREGWLGFDYPAQALDAVFSEDSSAFEMSAGLKSAIGNLVNNGLESSPVRAGQRISSDTTPVGKLLLNLANAGLPQETQRTLRNFNDLSMTAWGFFKRALTPLQIAERYNFDVAKEYMREVEDFAKTKTNIMAEADEVAREWKKLPKGKANELAKFIFNVSQLSDEQGKRFDQAQLLRWMNGQEALNGRTYSLDKTTQGIYWRMDASFSEVLKQLQEGLVYEAARKFTKKGREFTEKYMKAETSRRKRELVEEYTGKDTFEALLDEKGGHPLLIRLSEVERQFASLRSRNYFPRSRFGKYTVKLTARNEITFDGKVFQQGETAAFWTYETKAEWKKAQKDLLAEYGNKFDVSANVMSEVQYSFVGMPQVLIERMKNDSKMDLTEDQRTALDEISLQLSPGKSFLRHLEKRKGIKGYSEDALRTYASYMVHGGNHIARVKHSETLISLLEQMAKLASGTGTMNLAPATELKDYFHKHYKYIMNPENDWAKYRAIGFMWYLGFNVKSAFVNLTQVPMVTYPLLGARHGDARALKAIGKASSDVMQVLTGRGKLTADEDRALVEAMKAGITDQSFATELAGLTDGEAISQILPTTKGSRVIAKMSDWGGFMFKHTEQYNRRVAFLSAFRLALEDTKDYDQAFASAKDVVQKTMFEYSKWNRPEIMRGKKSVIFMFMQYMQHMSYLMYGLGNTPEARRTAARAWIVMFGMAGLLGLPGMEILFDLIDFFGTEFKELTGMKNPRVDVRESIREAIVDTFDVSPDLLMKGLGSQYGLGMLSLGESFGLPNVDISGSVSMGYMLPWLKDAVDPEMETDQRLLQIAKNIAGPVAQMPYSIVEAVASDDPDTWKRIERALPVALKNVSKATRWADRGKETLRGNASIKEWDLTSVHDRLTLVYQAMGFAPSELISQYEKYGAMQESRLYWNARRQMLMETYGFAVLENDREGIAAAKKDINRFNHQIRHNALLKGIVINSSDMSKSVKARRDVKERKEKMQPAERMYIPQAEFLKKLYGES